MAIPNLYQSFWGNWSEKNLEWPFLAILNLYQSFWEKLSVKIQNGHFWLFKIYTSLFLKKFWKKFRTAISGHSEFTSHFWEKLSEKIQKGHFWLFQIYTSLFGKKLLQKKLEWPFLAVLNLYQSFGKNCQKNSEEPFLSIPSFF